jgi:hypothetical protein
MAPRIGAGRRARFGPDAPGALPAGLPDPLPAALPAIGATGRAGFFSTGAAGRATRRFGADLRAGAFGAVLRVTALAAFRVVLAGVRFRVPAFLAAAFLTAFRAAFPAAYGADRFAAAFFAGRRPAALAFFDAAFALPVDVRAAVFRFAIEGSSCPKSPAVTCAKR